MLAKYNINKAKFCLKLFTLVLVGNAWAVNWDISKTGWLLSPTDKVGIGIAQNEPQLTTTLGLLPDALSVFGGITATNGNGYLRLLGESQGASITYGIAFSTVPGYMRFADASGAERVRITAAGKVGIGTSTPSEFLEVVGNIKGTDLIATNSIKIKNWTVDAPDYVFGKEYNLQSLSEVEENIKIKKHLPGVPSAKEFKEKGVDILEINLKLLQKIEELTLYAIEQDKRIKKLEKKMRVAE